MTLSARRRTISANILLAFLLALFAMGISYFCTNLNVSVSGERDVLKYWSFVSSVFSSKSMNQVPDDVLFINVSSDKQLVDRTDEFGIPIGNVAITDRGKLTDLLSIIKSVGKYQYTLLDVFFEEGFESDSDSLLFETIASMDRIVIPCHSDGILADESLISRAAYSDYVINLKEDNFTKYPLLNKKGGESSVPLKMYSDLTGRIVKKKGLLFFDKPSISRRVVFPKMYVIVDSPVNADGEKTYLNMASDLLDYRDDLDWENIISNKIIVIGSFMDDDIHQTYAGDVPGCVINYNVFTSLMRGQHRIPVLLIVLYFLLFFIMSLLILNGESSANQSVVWIMAKLFVLYSAVLTVVCILVFSIWGQAHDIFITSTFFSIVDTCHRRVINRKKNA